MTDPLDHLGRLIADKRGATGVRTAAKEVGISAATLSRVENGYMPDLDTFAKLCRWLGRDPSEFLGLPTGGAAKPGMVVHFRKTKTVSKETAVALGSLILAAQASLEAHKKLMD